MDHITRSEFVKELEPVKADAKAAKDLAEDNKRKFEEFCKSHMEFKEANNQEHRNILITIAKMAESFSGTKEEIVGLRNDRKSDKNKLIGFLVACIVALIGFIVKSGIL